MTIHWCGTGLSSIPGLRRLIAEGHDVHVWNRSLDKAKAALGDLTDAISEFDPDRLLVAVKDGDILVSMLPGELHETLAKMCLASGAHFISSSYITPGMRALDKRAREAGLALVNEVGLDPGIDHLMAHHLIADYRASAAYDPKATISFISYCGGIPKNANPFRYKFSWAPSGVLKALKSPSKSIRAFSELAVTRPWDAISSYVAPLPTPERFEVYPNRDSLPFIREYGFEPSWQIKEFVRGTLRLNGWADAWADVFRNLETLPGDEIDAWIEDTSAKLLVENSYGEGESDRVVLCVGLRAERDGQTTFHKTYVLDAWGDERGSAMARLVSGPVALAAKAIENRQIKAGVSAAPSDPGLVQAWMDFVQSQAQVLFIKNHLE